MTRIHIESDQRETVASLVENSLMDDREKAIGRYVVYHDVLLQVEPERNLYLAINEETLLRQRSFRLAHSSRKSADLLICTQCKS